MRKILVILCLFTLMNSISAIPLAKDDTSDTINTFEDNNTITDIDFTEYQLKEFPPLKIEDFNIPQYDADPEPTRSTFDLPDYFSWREYGGDWTTPAKNQASCGSCYAFSAVGAFEAAIDLASGSPDTNIDLSEQYVLSCLSGAGNCADGGWMHTAMSYIYSTSQGSTGNGINGCPIESCMPYQAVDYIPCSDKCEDWDTVSLSPEGKLWQIEDWGWTSSFNEDDEGDWNTMKTWLLDKGPLSVDIYASNGWSSFFSSHHSSTDVYEQDDNSWSNHGVVLVGWKNDPNILNGGYWILKNSWGSSFGYNGFFNVAYGCLNIGTSSTVWVTAPSWPNPEGPGPGPSDKYVIADFSYDNIYARPGETIKFNDKSQGTVVLRDWDLNDDGIIDSHLKRPEITYTETGDYEVKLTVWSEFGLNSTMIRIVRVRDVWPPVSVPKPGYYGGNNPVVEFEGRYSYDVDGNIVGYEWDFNEDGIVDSTEPDPIYEFPNMNGEYNVMLTVIDNEGAKSSEVAEIKIDISQPPSTSIVLGGIGYEPDWFVDNVPVFFEVSDWTGVDEFYYSVDGEPFIKIDANNKKNFEYNKLTIRGNGLHVIDFYAIDVYGNIESTKSKEVGIDSIAPNFNISFSGEKVGNKYLPPVTVTVESDDDISGIGEIMYYYQFIWYEYTKPFTITSGGSHNLQFVVFDNAGNSNTYSTSITIENPPSKPILINGPATGKPNQQYDYTFVSEDSSGDGLFYYIDWGDGTNSGWIGTYASGQEVTVEHTWSEQKDYLIKIKAKDEIGAQSDWTLVELSMPKGKFNIGFFHDLFERLYNWFPFLEEIMEQYIH